MKDVTNLIVVNILQYVHVLNHHTLNLYNVIRLLYLKKSWEKKRIESPYKNEKFPRKSQHTNSVWSKISEELYMYFFQNHLFL